MNKILIILENILIYGNYLNSEMTFFNIDCKIFYIFIKKTF